VSAADPRDGGHHIRVDPVAPAVVVPGRVAGDEPKVRSQRPGLAAGLGAGQLRNRLDLAAQAAPGHGASGRDPLKGTGEVDETFVGGVRSGTGRDGIGKALVVIAAEEEGAGIGRIRLARVPDASTPSLHGFIRQTIAPGSTIHTDGWAPYQGLERLGFGHTATRLKGLGKEAAVELLPRGHRVAALLKRWWLGTHQGAVSPTHQDYYLDEFTFRFDRRRSASRGKLFFRLLEQAVQVGPVTYDALVGKATCNPK